MSLQATESRPNLFSWTPPDGLSALKFLSEHPDSNFCNICQSDDFNRDELREGLLLPECCKQTIDMTCLKLWKEESENSQTANQSKHSLTCPHCRASLDDRIFYQITADDHKLSTTLRHFIDERNYSELRERLDLKLKENQKLPPFTYHSIKRHAASRDDVVALSILNNRKLLSQAGNRTPGFDHSVLYTAAVFSANKAAHFLLAHGATPDGTQNGRPLNIAMATGNLPLATLLNSKNVTYLADEKGYTPLISLYLGMMTQTGYWKTLKGAQREEVENTLVDYCLANNVDLSKTLDHPVRSTTKATALHLAALVGNKASFEKIVNRSSSNSLYNRAEQMTQRLLYLMRGNPSQLIHIDPPVFDTLHDAQKFEILFEKMPSLDPIDANAIRRGAPNFETLLNEALKFELATTAKEQKEPNYPITEKLLSKGHLPSELDPVHGSAFHVFALHSKNYNYVKETNRSRFFSSQNNSFPEQLQLLTKMKDLTNGCAAFSHPRNEATPLHHYITTHQGDFYSEEIVNTLSLLTKGDGTVHTSAKIPDNEGNTPLHYAVNAYYSGCHNLKAIQDLLLVGGDATNVKNTAGVSPKDLCRSQRQGDVLWRVFTESRTYPSCSYQESFHIEGNTHITTVRRLESSDPDYQRGFFDNIRRFVDYSRRVRDS